MTAVLLPVCAAAQESGKLEQAAASSAIARSRTLLPLLRSVEWRTAERGSLLVVVPTPMTQSSLFFSGAHPSLKAVAATANQQIITAGRVTAMVPRTMTVINTRPGKANPISDLSPARALPLLMSTFSPAQWQLASSINGIGVRDLTAEQRVFWTQILPEQALVQKTTAARNPQSGLRQYSEAVSVKIRPRSTARLRLNKTVDLWLLSSNGALYRRWSSYPYTDHSEVGSADYYNLSLKGTPPYVSGTAYGVPLIATKPQRLKIGAVDFSAPLLNTRISLANFPRRATAAPVTGIIPPGAGYSYELDKFSASAEFPVFAAALTELVSLPTIGDLLARISKETHREFAADYRVRDLHVYLRGDTARAGDLLEALCWSVAGTFRRIEPGGANDTAPLFLLTHDVIGIGTRKGILAEWGEAAEAAKQRLLNGADAATSRSDPFCYLSFAPNDPFSLSPAQAKSIEDGSRQGQYGYPSMLYAEMLPALQTAVRDFAIEHRIRHNAPIRTDEALVGETLKAVLLVPEIPGATVAIQGVQETIGNQYLQRIAALVAAKAGTSVSSAENPALSLGFAAPALAKQRRVLIARPASAAEGVQIVRAAIGRGIEAVWLETDLGDTKANVAMLTAAVRAGGTKIAVGGIVRLLNGGGFSASPDRNILGETSEEYKNRRQVSDKRTDMSEFTGWNALNTTGTADLKRRVGMLAAVPGLASLTFRATGAPGWVGPWSGSYWLPANSTLGYTASMRRAFLREYGSDPVDISESSGPSEVGNERLNPGYFQSYPDKLVLVKGPQGLMARPIYDKSSNYVWWAFRNKRNTALLADIFQGVRKTRPSLPLYIEDRHFSSRTEVKNWFGSWDLPGQLPAPGGPAKAGTEYEQARRTSKTLFARWDWRGPVAGNDSSADVFARQATEAALRTPPDWDGLVLDMNSAPVALVVKMLKGLPPVHPQ